MLRDLTPTLPLQLVATIIIGITVSKTFAFMPFIYGTRRFLTTSRTVGKWVVPPLRKRRNFTQLLVYAIQLKGS